LTNVKEKCLFSENMFNLNVHDMKIRKGISFRESVYNEVERFCYQEQLNRSLAVNVLIWIGLLHIENMEWIERSELIQILRRKLEA